MIGTCSLLRKKPSDTEEQFYHHWLNVHGPLATDMHGVLFYMQSHFDNSSPRTNDLAKSLGVQGMAEMWFETDEDRRICYTSEQARIADIDSLLFIGATARFVSEAVALVRQPRSVVAPEKLVFVYLEAPPDDLAERLERVVQLRSICGLTDHKITSIGSAPSQKREVVPIVATRIITVGAARAADVAEASRLLTEAGTDRVAVFDCAEHRIN